MFTGLGLAFFLLLAAGRLGAQPYLYSITDQGLYESQDIYGPTTNAEGWEVGTYASGYPLNSYSLVKRPGDSSFSALFSGYFYLDAAYGINDKNLIVGAMNLFYSNENHLAYRADGNTLDMFSLTDFTNLSGSGFTRLTRATRILDNGTIIGLGIKEGGATHVFELTPIAPELLWDTNGTTAGIPQGNGTWSLSSANWTENSSGTSVGGWINGAIARFQYNLTPATVTVTDNIVLEGIWSGYTVNGMTIAASGGGTLTFTGQGFIRMAGSAIKLTISAPIAGSAGLWLTGIGGDLFLEGDNSYTGQTRVSSWTSLIPRHANALGAAGTGNETIVESNGRVDFDQSLTIGETFVLNGGSLGVRQDYDFHTARHVTLTGPIVLEGDYGRIDGSNPNYDSSMTVSGVISESGGSHNLVVAGATLTGANTFTGDLIVLGEGATVSSVTAAGVAGPMGQGSRLVLGQNIEGANAGRFTYLGSTASTDREVYLEGGGTIDVHDTDTTLTLTGLISGSQMLEKAGAGTLSLTAANIYTGGTEIEQGTLRITGASALGTGPVLIDNGGMLTGSGTFSGNLTIHGIYSPGDSPGLVALSSSLVSLESDGLIHFEIGGLARGTQYDALDISGQFASEGGIKVSLINAFMPQLGDSFHLLSWGTAGSISFSNFDLPALNGGLYWETGLLASTGQITVSAVPEPSSWLLLGLGVAGGLLRWFRTRR
jgi:autotransporter-associated beta strand protein